MPGVFLWVVIMKLRKMYCPQCRKETIWEGNPSRPFCSDRCRLIDLGSWAAEEYRVPADKIPIDELEDE